MLVMGIIGGIFGIIASILAMTLGGLVTVFGADGSSVVGLGFVAMLFSILGIVGSAISKNRTKLAGYFLLISGIGGFICISWFWIITGILFIISGLMGILSKGNKTNSASVEPTVKPESEQL